MYDLNKYFNKNTLYDVFDVTHMESDLYINDGYLYKKMNLGYSSFDNKVNTINYLLDNKHIINIDELVLPIDIFYLNRDTGDIIIKEKFINNINFKYVLSSDKISFSEKIDFFKQIGLILDKMKYIREHSSINEFYLCDLYTDNFILNTDTNKINVVDMDSCKINGNNNNSSFYLFANKVVDNVSKYKKKEFSWFTEYEINENTDIFCYIVMLLNFISKCDINSLSYLEFDSYMNYLVKIGLSGELVDLFCRIYLECDNSNPYLLLDELNKCDNRKYILKK